MDKPMIVRIPIEQLRGLVCAWAGCEAHYEIAKGMPEGWRALLLYHENERIHEKPLFLNLAAIETWDRDAVLCPQHSRELETLLKVIR